MAAATDAQVTQHRAPTSLLDLNGDVLYEICVVLEANDMRCLRPQSPWRRSPPKSSLLSLCSTCRRIRYVGAPLVYRRAAVIDPSLCRTERQDLESALSSIEECEPYQRYGRLLFIQLGDVQSKVARYLLRQTTSSLNNLEALRLEVNSFGNRQDVPENLLEALRKDTSWLPSLRSLVISENLEKLLHDFDGISSLEIRNRGPYLNAPVFQQCVNSGKFSNLRELELNIRWHPQLLNELNHQLHHLEALGVVGNCIWGSPFLELLPALSCFPRLKTLTTVYASEMGVGFDPPDCGNAYMGPGGEERRRKTEIEEEKVLEYVGHETFEACRELKVIWMEYYGNARVVRRADGTVKEVTWAKAERLGVF